MNYPIFESHDQIGELLKATPGVVDDYIMLELEKIGVLKAERDDVLRATRTTIDADYRKRPDCGTFWSWTSQIATQEAVRHLRGKGRQQLEMPENVGEFNVDMLGRMKQLITSVLRTVPESERDDIVQEVLATVWAKRSSLRDPKAIRGWVATIAIRRRSRYLSSAQSLREALLDDMSSEGTKEDDQGSLETAVPADMPLPSDYLNWGDRASSIENCLEQLTEPDRTVFRMHALEGTKPQTIAKELSELDEFKHHRLTRSKVETIIKNVERQLRRNLVDWIDETPEKYEYRPYREVGYFLEDIDREHPIVIIVPQLLPDSGPLKMPRLKYKKYRRKLDLDYAQLDALSIEEAREMMLEVIARKTDKNRKGQQPDSI